MTDDPRPAPEPDSGPADRRSRLRVVTDTKSGMPAPDAATSDLDTATTDLADDLIDRTPDDDEADEADEADDQAREWAWVTQWRDSDEPPAWPTGLPLAAFAVLLTAVAVWVLSAGLAERPWLAVTLNLLVAGGLAPAMWLSRNLPVLRWFAAGAAVGVVVGWVAALTMLPAG